MPRPPQDGPEGGAAPFDVRVVRPADLLNFRVEFRGFEKKRGVPTDPLWAMAVTDDSRMVVHFPFQHAHEQAVYESPTPVLAAKEANPTGPPALEPPSAPTPHDTPAGFAPARESRVVFRVPLNDGVQLSTQGILEGMLRHPVAVAQRAEPEPPPPGDDVLDPGIGILLTPDIVATIHADRIVVAETTAAQRATAKARLAASPTLAHDLLAAIKREAAVKPIVVTPASERLRDRLDRLDLTPVGPLRPIDPTVFNSYSEPPAGDETAIEAPYRLILSPNGWARWRHAIAPVPAEDAAGDVELWHTRLAYARSSDDVDEDGPGYLRIVRALWARDRDGLAPSDWKTADADVGVLGTTGGDVPFKGSLTRADRHRLVRQTSETWRVKGIDVAPVPVRADKLHLSALGAWLELHGSWDTRAYSGLAGGAGAGPPLRSILRWDHVAPQGRDQFVRVMYPGYLYPFGHRATLVKITERKIRGTGASKSPSAAYARPKAALFQRMFIVLGDLTKDYPGADDLPFTSVTLSPIVSPDLDDPEGVAGEGIDRFFWPRRGGVPFEYAIDSRDRVRAPGKTHGPLLWVNEAMSDPADLDAVDKAYDAARARLLPFHGQEVSFVLPTAGGDAKLVTERIALRGTAAGGTSTPRMSSADVVLPAAQRLTGLGAIPIAYEQHYLDGSADPAVGVWAAILTPDIAFDAAYGAHVLPPGSAVPDRVADVPVLEFGPAPKVPGGPKEPAKSDVGSDRGGGFVQPSLPMRALSTQKGPVGDLAQATTTSFDPVAALKGALPRLFGLVSIGELIPDDAFENLPSVVTKSLHALEQLAADLHEAARLAQELADAGGAATADAQSAATQLEALGVDVEDLLASPDADRASHLLTDFRAATIALERAIPAATPLVRNRLTALVRAVDSVLGSGALAGIVTALANGIPAAGKDLTFRFDWSPLLSDWPKGGPILRFDDPEPRFTIVVEGRVPASGGEPQFEVLGELRRFTLDLLPGAPLLLVPFDHISFRSGSSGKTEVDVVLGELVFQGVLSFVNDIKDLIPLDGFSDPPFVEVSPQGVKAGFSLALPNLAIGVFSLSNISLGADVHVPFLGDIVTVGFNFCTREKPFVLSVCFLGGGGFFALRLSPERVELLELSLEAGAYLSVDFGVASGSISAAIGVYLRMESTEARISGFFRLRGEVDVLGLISASIELAMSLDYYPHTGKVIGRASITVEVEVLCFSGSVTIEAERQFAGSNGDPSFRDAYIEADGTHPEWDRYLDAFATEGAPA